MKRILFIFLIVTVLTTPGRATLRPGPQKLSTSAATPSYSATSAVVIALMTPESPEPPQTADAPPTIFRPATADQAGIDSVKLHHAIDSIVTAAIEKRAFPGCQLFVARNGNILIDSSFGHHDYSRDTPVRNDDMYDLASVTKMAASTLALARLVENGTIGLDDRLSKFYAPFLGTDKRAITFREVLSHQSGLPSGIPRPWLMSRDSLLQAIVEVRMRSKIYRYSDLPFLLVPQIVSAVDPQGRDFETFLVEEFYRPMGINLIFNPLDKGVRPEKIVPTETDTTWRNRTVHGTVHDESAAVMGGVSGNAGLFGTARDVATVMQMLIDGGRLETPGNSPGNTLLKDSLRQILRPETIALFTSQQYRNNRRGLGFDRPADDNHKKPFDEAYPAPAASQRSFGHTGFTGTIAWADPDCGLVYVLLCNRVTPSRVNPAFIDTRVRYALQQAVYDALLPLPGALPETLPETLPAAE